MSEKYSFLVIKYPKADTAMAAMAALRELSKDKVVKLKDAVAITKTQKGKIKLHQTKDDAAGKGFVKGGLVGILLAALLGPAGWVAAGALMGTAFAMFDRGIKNKLLKELGKKMTSIRICSGAPGRACRLADSGGAHAGAQLPGRGRRLTDY